MGVSYSVFNSHSDQFFERFDRLTTNPSILPSMGLKRRLYSGLQFDKLEHFGISVREFVVNIKRLPGYYRDVNEYRERATEASIPISQYYPILTDIDEEAGTATGHYFHQDIWAAKKIKEKDPDRHFDIGSRLDGFIAHLLTFREVHMIDIRPLDSDVEGLNFIQGDATELAFFNDNSVDSISSLHAAEHFGLGRYGDPIEPEAHLKFMTNLKRVLKPGGRLYFSVPVGQERVEFNAHRVLSPFTVIDEFEELELAALDGVIDGEFEESVSPSRLDKQDYACGLFEFTK